MRTGIVSVQHGYLNHLIPDSVTAGTPTSRRLNYPGKNAVEYECHLQSCIGSYAAGLYTLAMQYLFLLIPCQSSYKSIRSPEPLHV